MQRHHERLGPEQLDQNLVGVPSILTTLEEPFGATALRVLSERKGSPSLGAAAPDAPEAPRSLSRPKYVGTAARGVIAGADYYGATPNSDCKSGAIVALCSLRRQLAVCNPTPPSLRQHVRRAQPAG